MKFRFPAAVFYAAHLVAFAKLQAGATPQDSEEKTFEQPVDMAAGEHKTSVIEATGGFFENAILRPKNPFQIVPGKDPNGWSFVFEPYVWAMALNGDIDVRGLPPAQIGVDARKVLQHFDWGIFARGEVRKGRWGLLADGYYAVLSGSASLDDRIYESASLGLQQSLVSLALAYRLVDTRVGYLDLYAGARYNFLGAQLEASLNNGRINQIGTNAADAIAARVDSRIESSISNLQAAIAGNVQSAAAAAGNSVPSAGLAGITRRDVERLLLRDRDLRRLVRDDLIKKSLSGGRVGPAIREYARASAAAKASAARGVVDPRLEAQAVKARKNLGKAIASRITEVTPTYTAGDVWWVDPIIGLRGQLNITRWLFLAAQGDVGGFGAGSQIAWNTQATIGFNFTRNIFVEIGYRYYYVDYDSNEILYQMNSFGLFTGVGVRF